MIDIKNQTTEVLQQLHADIAGELLNRGLNQAIYDSVMNTNPLESLSIADLWALYQLNMKEFNTAFKANVKEAIDLTSQRAGIFIGEIRQRNNEIFENLD